MNKTTLINHVTKIFNMNLEELNELAVAISMSNVDDKTRYFLNRAIDMRKEELREITDPLVVNGEYDMEALGA